MMSMLPHRRPEEPEPQDAPPEPLAARLIGGVRGQSSVLVAILVLLLLYTLYLAQDVLVPLVLAVLLNLLLSPLVHRMRTLLRIPEPVGAALVLLALLGVVGYGSYALSGPAAEWLGRAPHTMAEIADKVRSLKQPVEDMQRATEQVQELTRVEGGEGPRLVTIEDQSWGEFFVVGTTTLLVQGFVVLVLLYFLLASGDMFMRRMVRALSSSAKKRRAVEIVHAVQRDVTLYLGTVTMINCGLGVVTGLTMAMLGMPNPVLWGVFAGLANFIPYAGAFVTIVVLAFVGLLTFDDLGYAVLPPALFFLFTSIEANFVTPALLGGRLTLNPALVFAFLVAWGWMWGIVGAALAVPLLVTLKAFADHLPSWESISIFLGRREGPS